MRTLQTPDALQFRLDPLECEQKKSTALLRERLKTASMDRSKELNWRGLLLGVSVCVTHDMPPNAHSAMLDEFLHSKPGYVFNAGGPIWGIDWCPLGDLATPSGMVKYQGERRDC
jgi:hypothetical protein